jgi:hypothetical protein
MRILYKFIRSTWVTPGVLLLAIIAGLSTIPFHAEAAVVLLYFRASSGNQVVRLEWATATELDTAGFFVQRSNQRDSGYIRINPEIIPAVGDAFSGDT